MGFFNSLLKQAPAVACVLPDSHAVIRQMVSVLGFDVVASKDYGSRLVPAINAAVEYFDAQIAAIPGPFDISAAQYTHHPLVHALFPTRQDISHALGCSRDIKQPLAFLAGAEQKEAFALLGARRTPHQPAGADGPKYCDHTVRTLAANETGARQGLRTAALTSLITSFGEHLDKLHRNNKLTRGEWNIENRKDFPVADGDKGKVVLAVDELRPDNLLQGLIAWLQRPAEHLQLRSGEARDAGAGAGDATHQIDLLPHLLCRDNRLWLVCIVRFPVAEGVAAIQNEPRQHRYIRI
ncbi:MAG: hypothetical protein FIA96_17555 [Betaproteobacteria bacterium]|nr:hypothetical protein [Betaproteobacteria bacterium]